MSLFGVSREKYNALERLYFESRYEYQKLRSMYNDLINRINDLGGEQFLNSKNAQFTSSELRIILTLCHPDKHMGNSKAEIISKRVNEVRQQL